LEWIAGRLNGVKDGSFGGAGGRILLAGLLGADLMVASISSESFAPLVPKLLFENA
jgi:hypothetical protein